MNARQLFDAINEIDGRYYEEAASYRPKGHRRAAWCGLAACLVAAALAALALLPNALKRQGTASLGRPDGISAADPGKNVPPGSSGLSIRMDQVCLNEVEGISADAARVWSDSESYTPVQWDRDAILAYYGRDLTPAYLPEGLSAAAGNGTAAVIVDNNGGVVEDTVRLGFYHAYYEDGSPRLTAGTAAKRGFSVTVSRIGILQDCIYLLPENERKTTDIGGTEVTFGHRAMPYGPYDPERHDTSGFYDMYTAEFILDGAEYQLIAEQMEAAEAVKVVASLICGREVRVD